MSTILKTFLVLIATLFVACSIDSITDKASEPVLIPDGLIEAHPQTNSSFSVTPSMLNMYLGLFCKNKKPDMIEPIIENGEILAYYVQYADNKGWDLIAADSRISPIISYSLNGTLGSDGIISSIEIALDMVDVVKNVKTKNINKRQAIWDFLDPKIIKTKTRPRGVIADGMWIAIDTTFYFDTIAPQRLISTKWHQWDPWNRYTPADMNYSGYSHYRVGCVPVSVGNILYKYLHNTTGVYQIPDNVSWDFNTGKPIFETYTTNWSNMAEDTLNYTFAEKNKTAKFLSWLGREMNSKYGYSPNHHYTDPTKTRTDSAIVFLQNYFNLDTSNIYNFNSVINNLEQGNPVWISAQRNNDTTSHAFVIDAYERIVYRYCITFEFDPYHIVTDEEYYSLPSWMFEWPSPGEFPDYDPDKEPAIKRLSADLTDNTYFMMRWGFTDYNRIDNVRYNARTRIYYYNEDYSQLYNESDIISNPKWKVDKSSDGNGIDTITYNVVNKMIYNFQIK